MDVRSALKSQYHAVLKTLHEVIEKCPDSMWNDPADGSARFWRVAFHTLFYAHQIVNIRHIQHHAAALSSRLRRSAGIAIDWVGMA